MKKKGFTLIELLAVIVILAVIALIVTPIINDVIASAKDAANKRSVEGHVKNIEYAIVNSTFDGGLNTNQYDCINTTDTVDLLTLPDSDPITCESYTIINGIVEKALQCTNIPKNWDKKYNYIKGDGIYAYSNNTSGFNTDDLLSCIDMTPTDNITYGNWENGRTASLSLAPGNYLVNLIYSDAYPDNAGGHSGSDDSQSPVLSYGNATCKKIKSNAFAASGTQSWNNNTYTTLYNFYQTYKCNVTENTTISYSNASDSYNHVPQGIMLEAIELKLKNSCLSNNNNGGGNGESGESGNNDPWNGVAAPVSTLANGKTKYEGWLVSPVKEVYFNVTTGTKCMNSDWSSNTSNKAGCLRFYAYLEDNLSYTMILDRNTTLTDAAWASSNSNSSGPVTASAILKADTDSWQGTITPSNYTNVFLQTAVNEVSYTIPYDTENYKARFITTDEIARITGREGFDAVSAGSSDWFYFDGAAGNDPTWHTQIATSSVKSNYYWLYNYFREAVTYGNYNNVSSGTAYWTSDAMAGTTNMAWLVADNGRLSNNNNNFHYANNSQVSYSNENGIRPVITVLKSAVD